MHLFTLFYFAVVYTQVAILVRVKEVLKFGCNSSLYWFCYDSADLSFLGLFTCLTCPLILSFLIYIVPVCNVAPVTCIPVHLYTCIKISI